MTKSRSQLTVTSRGHPFSMLVLCAMWLTCVASLSAYGATQEEVLAVPRQLQMKSPIGDDPREVIDPILGELRLTYTDVLLPGNGGLDIVVSRRFYPYGFPKSYTRPYGYGWRMDYGRVRYNNRSDIDITQDLVFEDHEGISHAFYPDNTYFPGTNYQRYVSTDRWIMERCINGIGGSPACPGYTGYRVTSPDGIVFDAGIFNNEGAGEDPSSIDYYYVHAVTDPRGNQIQINYDTNAVIPAIQQITSNDGRSVTFSYQNYPTTLDPSKYWSMLKSIAADGQVVTYQFQNDGFQEGFVGDRLLLTRVTGGLTNRDSTYQYGLQYIEDGIASPFAPLRTLTRRSDDGRITTYTYNQYYPCHWGDDCSSVVGVDTKTTSGVPNPGTWRFWYADADDPQNTPSRHPYGSKLSSTEITTPIGRVEYRYFNYEVTNGEAWKLGLLERIVFKELDGTIREEQVFSWGTQQLSNRPLYVQATIQDPHVYAAIKTQDQVIRDGTAYTTVYSNFDAYGSPQAIAETGNWGKQRTSTKTYYNNTGRWIIRKPQDETISGVGTIARTLSAYGEVLTENTFGSTKTFAYTNAGDVASVKDPNGNTTTFSNYYRGSAQNVVQPLGITLNRVVNAKGLVDSEADGNGNLRLYQYDMYRRRTLTDFPLGKDETTLFDPSGMPVGSYVVSRGSHIKSVTVDGVGETIWQVVDGGITTVYGYDAVGRKVFESYPGDTNGTTTTYDAIGRVTAIARPGSGGSSVRRFSYLPNNCVQMTDELGNVYYYYFQSYGDPSEQFAIKLRTPVADTWIGRTAMGLITTVQQGTQSGASNALGTPNGLVRTYGYNARWQLTSLTDPETGTTLWGRDAVGNKTSQSVGGSAIANYGYDALNRLTSINYPTAPDVTLNYDGNGQLTRINNGVAVRTFSYSANNTVTSESLQVDGLTWTMALGYNAKDCLNMQTYPSGAAIATAPDELCRATTVGSFVTSVLYHATGEPNVVNYGNGTTLTADLKARKTIKSVVAPGVNLTYNYDAADNVSAITDGVDGAFSQTMTYDNANRLTGTSGVWGNAAMSYNVYGDLGAKTIGQSTSTYGYGSGKLTSRNSKPVSYDVYGNLTAYDRSGVTTNFGFSDAGELIRANGAAYSYDGGSTLVKKVVGGHTRYSFYSYAKSALLGEYDDRGNVLTEYFYLRGRLAASQGRPSAASALSPTYYYWNALGSIVSATNANGTLAWREAYDPFGQQLRHQEDGRSSVFYTAKNFDKDAGLVYLAARWYDPELGRFISPDPLSFRESNAQSFNRYAYADDNPYRFIDPSGMSSLEVNYYIGVAHIRQGNKNHIGKGGGFDTNPKSSKYQITSDSTAISPMQWGMSKDQLRPKLDQIHGEFENGEGFNRVREVIDDKKSKQKLGLVTAAQFQQHLIQQDIKKGVNGGKPVLLLELPGASKEYGVMRLILEVPAGIGAPQGTVPFPALNELRDALKGGYFNNGY